VILSQLVANPNSVTTSATVHPRALHKHSTQQRSGNLKLGSRPAVCDDPGLEHGGSHEARFGPRMGCAARLPRLSRFEWIDCESSPPPVSVSVSLSFSSTNAHLPRSTPPDSEPAFLFLPGTRCVAARLLQQAPSDERNPPYDLIIWLSPATRQYDIDRVRFHCVLPSVHLQSQLAVGSCLVLFQAGPPAPLRQGLFRLAGL
jgi:hypothetical protein